MQPTGGCFFFSKSSFCSDELYGLRLLNYNQRIFQVGDLVQEKRDGNASHQSNEATWMQVRKRKKMTWSSKLSAQRGAQQGWSPCGSGKQQGKNVSDAGMGYWLQTDTQRGQLCHQFIFYWNCQNRGAALAGFSQWRTTWCSLEKTTGSADLARLLFSAEPGPWDLWPSLLSLRTREHLYRVAHCSSESGRPIFQWPLHSESQNSLCLEPESMGTQKQPIFMFEYFLNFLKRQMCRP